MPSIQRGARDQITIAHASEGIEKWEAVRLVRLERLVATDAPVYDRHRQYARPIVIHLQSDRKGCLSKRLVS